MTELHDRPRFYEGQYLAAADLTAAVDYTRVQRARTLLGAHRWGIALGLELLEVPGPNASLDVVVQPGYGWDGFGRPIVVSEPAKLSTGLFSSFDATFVPSNPPAPPIPVEVWIRYDETLGQGPRPGFEDCDAASAYSRVTERFAFEVGPRNDVAARRDPVQIAGRTMDAAQALRAFDPAAPELFDGDVPHQVLPGEGEFALWLLPLGVVMYLPGNPGKFVKRDEPAKQRHARSRQYAGVVAGSIEATGGVVRVHDRTKPYSTFFTSELLCVEGDIRSDGDLRMFGRKIEFVASHGEDPRVPFQVLRKDDPIAGTRALTLVIGDKSAGDNRLVVARRSGTNPDQHEPKLVVTDRGEVGIGTADPRAQLHLGEAGLQIGASSTPEDNFHIQSNTDGPRALRVYNKDVGSGAALLSLTSDGKLGVGEKAPTQPLHVNGALGIRQNAMYLSGGPGWSSLTFNAHHNAANSDWIFPNPSQPAVTLEMDDALAGKPRFEVFSTIPGNNQQWASRMLVDGHTGNIGIGTRQPTVRLDVNGDLRFAGLFGVGAGSGVRMVWGAVAADGSVQVGDGFAASNAAGAGRYDLTFTPPFTGQPTLIVTRVHLLLTANNGNAVTASETAVVDQVLSDRAVVATADGSGVRADGGFTFVAIGPR